MSDNNKVHSDKKSPVQGSFRDARSSNVTVEVRRKKVNLLDRKKALEQGNKKGDDKRGVELPGSLSSAEVSSRIEALRQASTRHELPPRRVTLPERVVKKKDPEKEADTTLEKVAAAGAGVESVALGGNEGGDAGRPDAQAGEPMAGGSDTGGRGPGIRAGGPEAGEPDAQVGHSYTTGESGANAESITQATSGTQSGVNAGESEFKGERRADNASGREDTTEKAKHEPHVGEHGGADRSGGGGVREPRTETYGGARGGTYGGSGTRDARSNRDGGNREGTGGSREPRSGTYGSRDQRGGSRDQRGGRDQRDGSRDQRSGSRDGAYGGRPAADGRYNAQGGGRTSGESSAEQGAPISPTRSFAPRTSPYPPRVTTPRPPTSTPASNSRTSPTSGSRSGPASTSYRPGRRSFEPSDGYGEAPRSRRVGDNAGISKDERVVPVILRAASYGPSLKQQAKEKEAKEALEAKAKEQQRKKELEPTNKFKRQDRSRTQTYGDAPSVVAPVVAKPERQIKSKKSADVDAPERRGVKKTNFEIPKKLSRNVLTRVMDDEEEMRVRSVASYKRAQKKRFGPKVETAKVVRDVIIPDTITVSDLSNRMAVSSALVIKSLMKLGTLASINQVIDGDTAELVCVEFGHRPKRTSVDDIETGLRRKDEDPANFQSRPPVITVMGHVDHGKTSLLDALRKTNVIATEFGGITQQIGAYQIVTPYSDAKITFFDTPGHAAFSEMRARGADVTDIVVLVVAADDGINEQTLEAISHAKAANASIIVAINKMDRPTADPQKIKNELLNHNVILEDFGGDVIAVEVSAKFGTNLDKLIEAILLQAEVLELKADPVGPAEGRIVEASVEKGRGIVATVLVQKGTLRSGDIFVAGAEFGRVKMMYDHLGQQVREAGPSCPVEVLGFNGSPLAGEEFLVVESEQIAREVADHRRQVRREKDALARNKNSIEHMMSQIASGESKTLNIIIKSDTQGSLEAITSNIQKLSVNGVVAQVVHSAIGDINETDVMLAKSSKACVIGFCVKATPQARSLADREDINLSYYTIIYEMLEQIDAMMKGQLAPTFEEHVLGRAELRVVFTKGKFIKIAGCYVTSGLMRRSNSQVRLIRGDKVVFTGKIDTMKHEKDDIKESREGHECGIILDGFHDIQKGDIIECFEVVEVRP